MIGRIMVSVGLPRHSKLHSLAQELGIDWPKALGHLVAIWCEVMLQRESGVLEGWARGDFERVSGWKGKPGALARALEKGGWIQRSKNDVFEIHDWEDHQGNIIEERRQDAVRKRIERAHKKGTHTLECPVDCAGRPSGHPKDVHRTSTPPSPPLPVPSLPSLRGGASEDGRPPSPPVGDGFAEEVEVAETVSRYAAWSHPAADKKAEGVRELRELGLSHEYIRNGAQVNKPADSGFWDIVKALKAGTKRSRFAIVPGHQVRENVGAYAPKNGPTAEERESERRKRDLAVEKCDKLLNSMDEHELVIWQHEAEEAAKEAKIPAGAMRENWIKSQLRIRIAKENEIEGL